jgi:hypothetical protein
MNIKPLNRLNKTNKIKTINNLLKSINAMAMQPHSNGNAKQCKCIN